MNSQDNLQGFLVLLNLTLMVDANAVLSNNERIFSLKRITNRFSSSNFKVAVGLFVLTQLSCLFP